MAGGKKKKNNGSGYNSVDSIDTGEKVSKNSIKRAEKQRLMKIRYGSKIKNPKFQPNWQTFKEKIDEEAKDQPTGVIFNQNKFFKTIENNILNPKTQAQSVVPPAPKEETKKTYNAIPIPGMSGDYKPNENNNRELTQEERMTQDLNAKKVYLKGLRNRLTSNPGDVTNIMNEINVVKGEIKNLNASLGLPDEVEDTGVRTNEQIEQERIDRLQAQKVELRDLEKYHASLEKVKGKGSDEEKQRTEIELNKTKKRIDTLKVLVPPAERLPIEDEAPENNNEPVNDNVINANENIVVEPDPNAVADPEQQNANPELTQAEKNKRLFGVEDVEQYRREHAGNQPNPNDQPNPNVQPAPEQQNANPELTQAEKNKRLFGVEDVDQYRKSKRETNAKNTQVKDPKKKETNKKEAKKEEKPISDAARIAVYGEKLKTYNNMYKLDVDSNDFAASVTDSWDLMISDNKEDVAKGHKMLNSLYKDTLKKAFEVEKKLAYDEHRLPEYAELVKSTNELMRSAMFGFTDLYHNRKRAKLFESTAFGGLNAKEIADLTTAKSLWSMDQKSDEAWEVQSKAAKDIAEKWQKADRPYEKLIDEMNALVKAKEDGKLDMQEAYNKLTAAEWMLTNNEKMMVEDPKDPYNPIPNWGNRYWKTLTKTREALGVPKHTSMRELIQSDYAKSAKAVESLKYNETQIFDGVLDPADRIMHDSLESQKEQFALLSAAQELVDPKPVKYENLEMTSVRMQFSVEQEDQRKKMKNEPKASNWIIDNSNDKKLQIEGGAHKK